MLSRTLEILAHQLVVVDDLIRRADQRQAWAEAIELEDLREHVQHVRSKLMRLARQGSGGG